MQVSLSRRIMQPMNRRFFFVSGRKWHARLGPGDVPVQKKDSQCCRLPEVGNGSAQALANQEPSAACRPGLQRGSSFLSAVVWSLPLRFAGVTTAGEVGLTVGIVVVQPTRFRKAGDHGPWPLADGLEGWGPLCSTGGRRPAGVDLFDQNRR